MSRMTMSSSASAGWPPRPSRLDQAPSCMDPPALSSATSQCWASTIRRPPARWSRPPAYSRARRMTRASCTPSPSSVNMRTPRRTNSAMGASSEPRRPMVMAAEGYTSQQAPAPSSCTSRTTAAQSVGGSVLGMATTAVNPPRAAPREPVSMVSASSRPGWRRWACRSTSPGATMQPEASSVRLAAGLSSALGTTAVTRPSPTTTSARRLPAESTTVPPRMAIVPSGATAASLALMQPSPSVPRPGRGPSRAAGTAPPCARPRRWPPARLSPRWPDRPRRRRFPRPGSWGRDA